jgi:hypothetical protein
MKKSINRKERKAKTAKDAKRKTKNLIQLYE